jgi:hypothetical protein
VVTDNGKTEGGYEEETLGKCHFVENKAFRLNPDLAGGRSATGLLTHTSI